MFQDCLLNFGMIANKKTPGGVQVKKKIFFEEDGNVVIDNGEFIKVIFNKDQIKALEIIINKILTDGLNK